MNPGFAQVGQRFSPKPQDDLDYLHTRRVLQDLGLERYEKNLKRGHLNDQVLPLLTDRWGPFTPLVPFDWLRQCMYLPR